MTTMIIQNDMKYKTIQLYYFDDIYFNENHHLAKVDVIILTEILN